MSSILSIIIPLLSLAGGVFAGKVFFSKANKNFEDEAKRKADDILKNAEVAAENLKKDRMLEAKENFLRLRGEFEEETQAKKGILQENEQILREKERVLAQQQENQKPLQHQQSYKKHNRC